jgi:hypothetical protein
MLQKAFIFFALVVGFPEWGWCAATKASAPPKNSNRAFAPREGGKVAWARLVTESPSWTVHQANDPLLADFIRRQSTLNLDPRCYPADSGQLTDLSNYPFIFTNNLTDVHSPARLANVREYLRRGGFIYIDRCVNLSFSLEQELFYRRHIDLINRLLPGCKIRELSREHEIFRCYFSIQRDVRAGTGGSGHDGIYGVYDEGRMVALLSLANYQCGWPNSRDQGHAKMEMIANIYVYAMTSGLEAAAAK